MGHRVSSHLSVFRTCISSDLQAPDGGMVAIGTLNLGQLSYSCHMLCTVCQVYLWGWLCQPQGFPEPCFSLLITPSDQSSPLPMIDVETYFSM